MNRVRLAFQADGGLTRIDRQQPDASAASSTAAPSSSGGNATKPYELKLSGCVNLGNDVLTCSGQQVACKCNHEEPDGSAGQRENWCCDKVPIDNTTSTKCKPTCT